MNESDLETLPLFIVDEQNEGGDWQPIYMRRDLFRNLADEVAGGHVKQVRRARRVKTPEEAKTLSDLFNAGLWLEGVLDKITWVG